MTRKSEYYQKHREEILLKRKQAYWAKTPEERTSYLKAQYQKHRPVRLEYFKQRYSSKRIQIRQQQNAARKSFAELHPEQYKLKKQTEYQQRKFRYAILFIDIMTQVYEFKCFYCGVNEAGLVHVHHVYNDGADERKILRNQATFFKYYVEHPDEAIERLRFCCPNCNKRMDSNNRGNIEDDYELRLLRRKIAAYIGERCVACGLNDERCREFDHTNNDGAEDRMRFANNGGILSPAAFIRYYAKHLEEARMKLQTMCSNCNWRKRLANNDCTTALQIFS